MLNREFSILRSPVLMHGTIKKSTHILVVQPESNGAPQPTPPQSNPSTDYSEPATKSYCTQIEPIRKKLVASSWNPPFVPPAPPVTRSQRRSTATKSRDLVEGVYPCQRRQIPRKVNYHDCCHKEL